MEKKEIAREFVRTGYSVRPSVNGGFVVVKEDYTPRQFSGAHPSTLSLVPPAMAAFGNVSSLLSFLEEGHMALKDEAAAIRDQQMEASNG